MPRDSTHIYCTIRTIRSTSIFCLTISVLILDIWRFAYEYFMHRVPLVKYENEKAWFHLLIMQSVLEVIVEHWNIFCFQAHLVQLAVGEGKGIWIFCCHFIYFYVNLQIWRCNSYWFCFCQIQGNEALFEPKWLETKIVNSNNFIWRRTFCCMYLRIHLWIISLFFRRDEMMMKDGRRTKTKISNKKCCKRKERMSNISYKRE